VRPAARLPHPTHEIEGREGCQNGNSNREHHEPGVVVAMQRSVRQAVVFKHRCVSGGRRQPKASCQFATVIVPDLVDK
jgi:hypothetical protein